MINWKSGTFFITINNVSFFTRILPVDRLYTFIFTIPLRVDNKPEWFVFMFIIRFALKKKKYDRALNTFIVHIAIFIKKSLI